MPTEMRVLASQVKFGDKLAYSPTPMTVRVIDQRKDERICFTCELPSGTTQTMDVPASTIMLVVCEHENIEWHMDEDIIVLTCGVCNEEVSVSTRRLFEILEAERA